MGRKIIAWVLILSTVISIALSGCASSNSLSEGETTTTVEQIEPSNTPSNPSEVESVAENTGVPNQTSDATTPTETITTPNETEPAPTETEPAPTETEPAPTETEPVPTETVPPATQPIATEPEEESDNAVLTTTQRNSINMLNYITVLTQEINASKGSRIYLESVQSSLLNNIYPNAVDSKTQSQINNLWKTIDEYRMISVKRDRLEYIYEQNKAQAMREAIPNPLGLLSAVQSGNMLKTAASVLYMAVDATSSYNRASTKADLEYLQSGWELEDAETNALSASQLNLLNYSINMVRDNDFPGEYGLTEAAVTDFVKWANEDNLVRKINWLEENENTYQEFRTYWLELAQSYFESDSYRKCLNAIEQYEKVATRIFRKDHDYAETLPMAIVSAKKVMSKAKYVEFADKYLPIIRDNCDNSNWTLRYFVAQVYIDLYATTDEKDYLKEAYDIAYANVNELVDEQGNLNEAYLQDIIEVKVEKGATKREKQEVKEYNQYLNKKRSVELPPVSEAFYLNCELLFALAEELNISRSAKKDIDATIHENNQPIFLTEALDNRFWATKNIEALSSDDISIEFNGEKIVIPASCLTDRSVVTVSSSNGTVFSKWKVKEVKRPKNALDCSEYSVTMTCDDNKNYKYTAGEIITITIIPVADAPDYAIEFVYKVLEKKTMGIIKGITFERIT